eukprot:3111686-Prymnesium_polylepis.1
MEICRVDVTQVSDIDQRDLSFRANFFIQCRLISGGNDDDLLSTTTTYPLDAYRWTTPLTDRSAVAAQRNRCAASYGGLVRRSGRRPTHRPSAGWFLNQCAFHTSCEPVVTEMSSVTAAGNDLMLNKRIEVRAHRTRMPLLVGNARLAEQHAFGPVVLAASLIVGAYARRGAFSMHSTAWNTFLSMLRHGPRTHPTALALDRSSWPAPCANEGCTPVLLNIADDVKWSVVHQERHASPTANALARMVTCACVFCLPLQDTFAARNMWSIGERLILTAGSVNASNNRHFPSGEASSSTSSCVCGDEHLNCTRLCALQLILHFE